MNELNGLMHKGRVVNWILVGIALIATILTSRSAFWSGTSVGLLVGASNLEILFNRVRKSEHDPQMLRRSGLGLRFGMATLGVIVVIKLNLGLAGFFLGLMMPHILISMLYALPNFNKERGE